MLLLESFPWRPRAWSPKTLGRPHLVRPHRPHIQPLLWPPDATFVRPTGALDGEGFGFRPAPSLAPDFASLPAVLPDLPAVANLAWQSVGELGAPAHAASVSLTLDGAVEGAPNLWGALLPAVAPGPADTASPLPPPMPPPMPRQPPPLLQPPVNSTTEADLVDTNEVPSTTRSTASEPTAVARSPPLNDRSAMLASLQNDNPLARLKKSSSRPPPPSSGTETDAVGLASAAPEQPSPAATSSSNPHASLMNAILLGPKLRSSAERRAPGPRPTVVETPREALMEAIKARPALPCRGKLTNPPRVADLSSLAVAQCVHWSSTRGWCTAGTAGCAARERRHDRPGKQHHAATRFNRARGGGRRRRRARRARVSRARAARVSCLERAWPAHCYRRAGRLGVTNGRVRSSSCYVTASSLQSA